MSSRLPPVCRGFTLVECMAAIGVVSVVLALVLSSLAHSKRTALLAVGLVRSREAGLALSMYCEVNREFPPVFFPPDPRNVDTDSSTYVVDGNLVRGNWWFNGDYFPLALDPPLPVEVLLAPSEPVTRVATFHGVRSRLVSAYRLSHSFFAQPSYWTRNGRFETAAWSAQRLTSTAFPSSKGLLRQMGAWHDPRAAEGEPGTGAPTCCLINTVQSAVLWSDLSASSEVQGRLRKGIANPYYHLEPLAAWADGYPIDETENGVLGRDR